MFKICWTAISKTHDGQDYDWSNAGRAGRPRKNDRIVTNKGR